MTKKCTKCNSELNIEMFYRDKHKKSGYTSKCKDCCRCYVNETKGQKSEYDKKYSLKYKDIRNKRSIEWIRDHKEEKASYDKQYRISRKELITEQHRIARQERERNDPSIRMICNMRCRIRSAIRNGYGDKAYKTLELLGCSFEEVKLHLESQFVEGMTWDNYGEWHIDHIKPCASFDLTDPEQQNACFNYKNLQPLWASDNLKKGSK